MTDLDLDAPVAMSRRKALTEALGRLREVIDWKLDKGRAPGGLDCESIREAARLVEIALMETPAEKLARVGVAP